MPTKSKPTVYEKSVVTYYRVQYINFQTLPLMKDVGPSFAIMSKSLTLQGKI